MASHPQKHSQEPWAVYLPAAPAQEGSTSPKCGCFLPFFHLFSLSDLLWVICALFLPQHFLLLTRCPSIYQAASSDIPTFYNKRKGREWVSLQTKLRNKQQSLCTLTASESFCQTQHKEQNAAQQLMLLVFFRRQPLDPLRLLCSKETQEMCQKKF